MLRNKSVVQPVKGKRNQIQVTLNANSEPIRLTTSTTDETEEWLDALVSTVRDLGLQDVFEIEYNDIQFQKTPSGELVSIGKGGSSNVVRGQYSGRPVAVKLYKNLRGTSSDALRNEVMLLNAVKHPNILPIIGITKPPNVAVIMPIMENGSLFDALHGSSATKLEPSKYTWQVFFKIADDVARAVEYLHGFRMNGVKQPIIHSDLKSANLLVRELSGRCAPSVYLIDFGISIQNDLESSRRQGTVCYMAPELLKSGGKITPKVDVFAYGVLLAELVTLKIPFLKVAPKQIEAAVLKGDRMPLPDSIPDTLRKLINACWAQSPSDRPSMAEVRQGLCEVAAELIVSQTYHETVTQDEGRRRRSGTTSSFTGKQLRLYDRRKEATKIMRVLQTFNKSATGAEVIFVSGHSGYGKTALMTRIGEFATVKGWVSFGKFNKDDKTPYSAIQKSMRQLMAHANTEWGADEKLEIRNRISFAFDESGIAAICQFIPEFAPLLDRTEEWIEKTLKSVSAEKFLSTIVKMFRLMTGGDDQPLIMVLDDMQWADQASLSMLARLMSTSGDDSKGDKGHVLPPANIVLIAGYRDNEVDDKHVLNRLFRSKLDASHITPIALGTLALKDVAEMIEETFPTFDRKKVDSLAAVVMDKSYGVPFFIHQFLQNMTSRTGAGDSSVDVLTDVSDSDIIASNLGDLTSDQQAVLIAGSFIAGGFSTKTLSRVFRHISIAVSGRSGAVKLSQREKADSAAPLAKRETILSIAEELTKRGILQSRTKSSFSFAHEQVRDRSFSVVPSQIHQPDV
jgi:serine/threonine protein kinase